METYYSNLQATILDNLDKRRNKRNGSRKNTDSRSRNNKNQRIKPTHDTERISRSHCKLVQAIEMIYAERDLLQLQYEEMMDECIEQQQQYRRRQEEEDEEHHVSFTEAQPIMYDTYHQIDYDRSSAINSENFNPVKKRNIRCEMNIYKSTEMNVHKDSQQNNRYYSCPYCNCINR